MSRSAAAALLAILLAFGVPWAVGPAGASHVNPDDIIDVLPRDAIPAILSPTFNEDPSWHPEDWLVVGVDLRGDPRAYPLAILNWHEIANDIVGGVPVAVSYCPLCRTAIVYDRAVESQTLTFGVSGKLYKNDLVMYDHQTDSYWTQILGEAILGTYHGTRLRPYSSVTMPWGEWLGLHPGSKLLDRPRDAEGQFLRNYNENPYAGYDGSGAIYFPQENTDPLGVLHPKEVVLGLLVGGEARAYPISVMRNHVLVNDVLGGVPIVVTYAKEAMKAFERGDRNFTPAGEIGMTDDSGRTYDRLTGVGPDGTLTEVPSVTAFWFAWYDFYPATSVYGLAEYSAPPAAPGLPLLAIAVVAGGGVAAGVAAFFVHRVRKARAWRKKAGGRRS